MVKIIVKIHTLAGFELGFDYLGSICAFRLFLGGHFPFLRVA